MRAVVTGATGFLGRRLCAALAATAGGEVTVLSRDAERARRTLGDVAAFAWSPEEGPPPAAAFRASDGRVVDAVFHLAGEAVAGGRWSDARRARIRGSRIGGTRNLVATLEGLAARPRVVVCASAVGYYGSRGDEILEESAPPASDFLADVCRCWEAEAGRARALGMRVVTARMGVVLGEEGGALARLLPPFRLGLGGRLGDGAQWMPWVHVDDVVGLLLHAATCDDLDGALNVVSPAPVRNRDFTRALARAVGRPAILPVPAAALRLALGEMSSLLLVSQRAVPAAAERTGYRFHHADLAEALAATVGKSKNME